MSITRIDHEPSHTHGWQARAHTTKGEPRLTKLFADGEHGGRRNAKRLAEVSEARLKRRARKMRGAR